MASCSIIKLSIIRFIIVYYAIQSLLFAKQKYRFSLPVDWLAIIKQRESLIFDKTAAEEGHKSLCPSRIVYFLPLYLYFCRVVSTLKRWRILRRLLKAIFVAKIRHVQVTSKTRCHYSNDLQCVMIPVHYSYSVIGNSGILQKDGFCYRRRDGLLVYVGGSKEVIQRQ